MRLLLPKSFRNRLLMLGCAGPLLAGILTPWMVEQLGMPGLLALAPLSLMMGRLLVRLCAAPMDRLLSQARTTLGEEIDSADRNEFEFISEVISTLDASRHQVSREAFNDFQRISETLSLLASGMSADIPRLAATGPVGEAAKESILQVKKALQVSRQTSASYLGLLQSTPLPAVITDRAWKIRYANPAATRLLGISSQKLVGASFLSLIARIATPDAGGDPSVAFAEADGLRQWGAEGARTPLRVAVQGAGGRVAPVEFRAGISAVGKETIYSCVMTELTDAWTRESIDRAAIRERLSREFIERFLEEVDPLFSAPAGNADDGESAGKHRRAMGDLDGFRSQLRWFAFAGRGTLPPLGEKEIRPDELLERLRLKTLGRFQRNRKTLRVITDEVRVRGEEHWIETIIEGLLLHACEASLSAEVEIRWRHLETDARHPGPRIELVVPGAGELMTAEEASFIDNPYGGWRAATLTRFQAGGFPIGLLVAARLSARLGGGLHFPPVPGAGVSLRVVLPCGTAETYREEEPSSGYAEEIPLAETFTGWQLGRPEPLLF